MDDAGFIYFAKANNLIKVGCSTTPDARMTSLLKETGICHKLLTCLPVANMHRWERWTHILLAQYHHHGEYFKMPIDSIPTTIAFIKSALADNPYGLKPVSAKDREWFYARRGSRNPNCLRMYIGGFDLNNFEDEYKSGSQELADLFWSGASNTLEDEYRNTLK